MHDWWVAVWWSISPTILISWIFWVICSIVLHELGHGVVAMNCGDDVPLRTGHMTLNPLVHIPRMAWLMFLIMGFTWGLMPTNPSNYRGRYDGAKVAFAGPAVNLLLLILCAISAALWLKIGRPHAGDVGPYVGKFLWTGCLINAMGFVFNLIPVPPLDGSRILADIVPAYQRLLWNRQASMVFLGVFAFLFFYGGEEIWNVAGMVATAAIRLAGMVVGAPEDLSPVG